MLSVFNGMDRRLRRREGETEFTVLDLTNDTSTERVSVLVQGLLAKHAIGRTVGPDDDLGASGLSSLDIVNLMLAVEVEFNVKIPEREMTPANFRSIARIDALVGSLLSEG